MDPFGGMLGAYPSSGNPYTFSNTSKPVWQSTRLAQPPMPGPTLSAAPRTLGQMVRDKVAGAVAPATGQRFANNLADLVDYTPVGAATQAYQFGQDLRNSNWGSALANGVGTALNAVPDGAMGGAALHSIIAPLFHGSPHTFEKFALDKIGTGEGAQAYGHGLYFAENPAVAQEYQRNLSGASVQMPDGTILNQTSMPFATPQDQARRAAIQLLADNGSVKAAKRMTTSPGILSELDNLNGAFPVGSGNLYKVSLDAKPEDFLDWDKGVFKQPPKVQDLLASMPGGLDAQLGRTGASLVGSGMYGKVAGAIPNEHWLANGVQGVRYLDQGSRTAGQGSSNYVVFDPSIISILGRN